MTGIRDFVETFVRDFFGFYQVSIWDEPMTMNKQMSVVVRRGECAVTFHFDMRDGLREELIAQLRLIAP